jgi:ALG6, ALG8 glycosyltransferase family
MLAFALLAVLLFQQDRDLLGAAAFVASMCFKQMALYFAPAVLVNICKMVSRAIFLAHLAF